MLVGLIPTYLTGNIDVKTSKEAIFLFREPREFEYLRTLVDGAHWQGQKKLKRPDRSGREGHIGCSEGLNFNLYKQHSIPRKGTNTFKTDEVVIKPLPDELQFLHDFFKSIFCHNKSEE